MYHGTDRIVDYFNEEGIIFLTDTFDVSQLSPELYESKKSAILDNFNRVLAYNTVEDWIYENHFSS